MICGINVDALIGGLQDKLNEAKASALGMVNQLAADAKAEAEKLKTSMETEIRGWMAELPEIPELPKIPMSVEMMALASKLAGYAADLANNQLPQDAKDAIAKEIAEAKKAFKDEWGEALDKHGIDLDKILDALNGKEDIDPCALIPNLQKGVDGIITMATNMPTFPIDGALKEVKSEISAVAVEAKGAIDTVGEVVSANVDVVAKQMQKVQDSTSTKTAADMKKARSKKSPSNSKTSTIKEKIVDVKEHKLFVGFYTVILIVEDFEPEHWWSHGYFKFYIDLDLPASGVFKGVTMNGKFWLPGNKEQHKYTQNTMEYVGLNNPGNVASTPAYVAELDAKLKASHKTQQKQHEKFLNKKDAELVATEDYTFVSGKYLTTVLISNKNANGSMDSYTRHYNIKVYTKKGFWD